MFKRLLKETNSEFYKLQKHSLYHDVISLVISQRIPFKRSKEIRQKLGKICFPFTAIEMQNIDFSTVGLTNKNIIECIKQITTLELQSNLNINTIKDIKGIGKWTYKALQIMGYEKVNLFLKEDAWIRKRLTQIVYGQIKTISMKEAQQLVEQENCNLTQLSLFLWRIKDCGVVKIKNGEKLTRDNFL